MFLGARFWLAPAGASAAFGIANSPPTSTGFSAWLSVKGTRDIASGCFIILLMASGSPRVLGEFRLVASLIAFGDMVTVLRSGGSRALAFGIHGLTGVVIVLTGACLSMELRDGDETKFRLNPERKTLRAGRLGHARKCRLSPTKIARAQDRRHPR